MSMEMIDVVVEFDAGEMGLTPPPSGIDISFVPSGDACALTVRTETESSIRPLADWLIAAGALNVEQFDRRLLRARLPRLPALCAEFSSVGAIREMRLAPGVQGRAVLHGSRPDMLPAIARLREEGSILTVRRVTRAVANVPLLTFAQFEALSMAAKSGYYQIPRPLNLHDLASRMGASTAALSERLRRAEGRIIVHYLNHEGDLLREPASSPRL